MKRIIEVIVLIAALVLPSCVSQPTSQVREPEGQVSVDMFYSQLHPYGVWIDYPGYGRVWVPDVGYGFTPYETSGHWVYTSWGWTWESYYRWGWAPFHYGRWFNDPMYGWVWVPDTVWGPAWVVWSTGGGYCGWAPLAPRVSVSVAVSGRYTIPREHWVFVREDDLSKRRVDRYRVEKSKNSELLSKSYLVRETRAHRQATYTPGPRNSAAQRSMNESMKYNDTRTRNDRPRNDRQIEERSKYNDTRTRNDRQLEERSSRNSSKTFKQERPSDNRDSRERTHQNTRSQRPSGRSDNRWENSNKYRQPNGRQGRESVDRKQSRGQDKKGGG